MHLSLKHSLSKRVMINLTRAENALEKDAYTVKDLFNNLDSAIWTEKVVSANKRMLQKIFVTLLCDLYTDNAVNQKMGVTTEPKPDPKDFTESSAIAYYQIIKTLNHIKTLKTNDYYSNAHYSFLIHYIEKSLNLQKLDNL